MTAFSVRGVNHVHVTSPEELVEDVVEWYASCLGLERLEKPEGTRNQGAWFKAGEQEIHISVDEHNPPKDAHFCLAVESLDPVVEGLRGAGCHIEQAASIPGRHRFFTRDPAGNSIEFMSFDEQGGAHSGGPRSEGDS